MNKELKNFINFIRSQGVVGLSVGFVLGGSIVKVVSSLVADIITPVLGIILGATGNLKDMYVTIGASKIMWGSFVNNVIDFIVVAAVVYYSIKILRLDKLDKKA